MEYPKLRNIEAVPVNTSSGKMVCLKDPEGFCTNQIVISPGAFFIITRFDGKHTVREIQAEYTRQFGTIILSDKIKSLINQMDEQFLLESERFSEEKKKKEEEYKKLEVRPPSHSGDAYPDSKELLLEKIKSILEKGEARKVNQSLKGLIAPHIDYNRGEKCYGTAYRALEGMNIDLFVIFGTCHMPGSNFFILTDKDFETPMGRLKNSKNLMGKLQKLCPFDLFENEILHKQEHSIELQLPFIQYYFPHVEILPILCTSYREKIEKNHIPSENDHIRIFIESLKKILSESNKNICLIAGADFSHTGFNFGDTFPLTDRVMKKIEKKDLNTISYIERLDSSGFYNSVKEDEDFRKICGLPPIYALMEVTDGREGKLLRYDQWIDYDIQSSVTFAGIGVF